MIETISSKAGPEIYVYNGKSLSSRYEPIKEARDWLNQYKSVIRGIRTVIVLGAGSGFHIVELRNEYPNLPILVLDPRADLCRRVSERWSFSLLNINFITNVAELPDKVLAASFLSLRHMASWAGYENFFTQAEKELSGRYSHGFEHQWQLRPELGSPMSLRGTTETPLTVKDLILNLKKSSAEPQALSCLQCLEELVL